VRTSQRRFTPCAHLCLCSAVLYILGVAGMLAMPFAARNTYMDENALLAGASTEGSACRVR